MFPRLVTGVFSIIALSDSNSFRVSSSRGAGISPMTNDAPYQHNKIADPIAPITLPAR